MIAREAPGWTRDNEDVNDDSDLRYLTGNETVIIGETDTADYPNIDDELEDYTAMIKSGNHPPVWVWSCDGCLITGEHRLTAAHRLGMTTYPAIIVQ